MATFRKETFYTMRRLDDGSIDAVRVNGWTDGKFDYYSKTIARNVVIWYAIDKSTGLSLCKGNTRQDVTKKVETLSSKFNDYKATKEYQKKVLDFYNAKVRCGAIVELKNN